MYDRVFVAGTFDHLHRGHEAILTAALNAGEKVTLGLTSDLFVKNYKKNSSIAPFDVRKKNLETWLSDHQYNALIISIDNPYEPAASLPDLEILVVSAENKSRGEEINTLRKEKGLAPLGLLVVPLVPAEDEKPLSSTRVREGIIVSSRLAT